jgi:hypothetical protein
MNVQSLFEPRTLKGIEFFLPGPVVPEQTIKICQTAKPLIAVCERLLQETSANASDVTVNLALLTLQEKFFTCYEHAPAACRKHQQSEKVVCLFQTYRQTYLKLFELQLKVTPPRLREPPPPPVQQTIVYKYDGFAIGETVIEDDEEDE